MCVVVVIQVLIHPSPDNANIKTDFDDSLKELHLVKEGLKDNQVKLITRSQSEGVRHHVRAGKALVQNRAALRGLA